MTLEEAKKEYDYVFVTYYCEDGYQICEEFVPTNELDDFMKENRIYKIEGTKQVPLYINAEYIVEYACEDSYEDCFDDVLYSGGMERLQKYLDAWCNKYGNSSYQVNDVNIEF